MAANTFRKVRIFILLLVLSFVAAQTWLTQMRTTDWEQSLWVVIYPINADGSAVTAAYIAAMEEQDFDDIEEFFIREALRYDLQVADPVTIKLSQQIIDQPPQPPMQGSMPEIIFWSLKLRYWAWTHNNYDGPRPDIQIFVKYHDPARSSRVGHSLGLKKGMVGVVNAFAMDKMAGSNNVIIAHELLHTVGAEDKYDPSNNQPLYPIGFADPAREPLYPQRKAEIMAGRIPVSEVKAITPRSLSSVVLGAATAAEISWQ